MIEKRKEEREREKKTSKCLLRAAKPFFHTTFPLSFFRSSWSVHIHVLDRRSKMSERQREGEGRERESK